MISLYCTMLEVAWYDKLAILTQDLCIFNKLKLIVFFFCELVQLFILGLRFRNLPVCKGIYKILIAFISEHEVHGFFVVGCGIPVHAFGVEAPALSEGHPIILIV